MSVGIICRHSCHTKSIVRLLGLIRCSGSKLAELLKVSRSDPGTLALGFRAKGVIEWLSFDNVRTLNSRQDK